MRRAAARPPSSAPKATACAARMSERAPSRIARRTRLRGRRVAVEPLVVVVAAPAPSRRASPALERRRAARSARALAWRARSGRPPRRHRPRVFAHGGRARAPTALADDGGARRAARAPRLRASSIASSERTLSAAVGHRVIALLLAAASRGTHARRATVATAIVVEGIPRAPRASRGRAHRARRSAAILAAASRATAAPLGGECGARSAAFSRWSAAVALSRARAVTRARSAELAR